MFGLREQQAHRALSLMMARSNAAFAVVGATCPRELPGPAGVTGSVGTATAASLQLELLETTHSRLTLPFLSRDRIGDVAICRVATCFLIGSLLREVVPFGQRKVQPG